MPELAVSKLMHAAKRLHCNETAKQQGLDFELFAAKPIE